MIEDQLTGARIKANSASTLRSRVCGRGRSRCKVAHQRRGQERLMEVRRRQLRLP